MHQKYTICREDKEKRLSVKEYAILEKTPKSQMSPVIGEDLFTILYEETYDSSMIVASIGKRSLRPDDSEPGA